MSFMYQDWLFIPIFGFSIFFVSYFWSDKVVGFLYKKSLGSRDHIMQRLDLMFVEVNQKQVTLSMLLLSFGLGFLFFLLLWPHIAPAILLAIIVTILGWQAPRWIVDYLYHSRCR